jgi:hypothetical protein
VRRGAVLVVALGAVLLIAAVAGFIVVPEHSPGRVVLYECGDAFSGTRTCHRTLPGWSRTAYDVLRVTTWALAIIGVVFVAMGLIRYAQPEVQR